MPTPAISYVTAGARNLAAHFNSVKDYLDYLLNPPGVLAYRSVVGTVNNDVWSGAIGLDQEDFDRDGMHNTASSNSRITFNTAGRYRITARLTFDSNSTGWRALEMRLNSNGFQTGGSFLAEETQSALNGKNTCLELNMTHNFVVGDYIEMFGRQTSGIALGYITGLHRTCIEARLEGTS